MGSKLCCALVSPFTVQQNVFSNLFNASGCWEVGEVATVFYRNYLDYILNCQHFGIARHGLARAGVSWKELLPFALTSHFFPLTHLYNILRSMWKKKRNRKVHSTGIYSPSRVQTPPRQQCHLLAWTRKRWVASNKMELGFILTSQSFRSLWWKWFSGFRSWRTTEASIAMVSKSCIVLQVVDI